MDSYPPFVKGLELNKGFFFDVVKPILEKNHPGLPYSASLLGYGSDVLGFDTETSMDHNWGPRLQLFIDDEKLICVLNEFFKNALPLQYRDFSVNFTDPEYDGVQRMEFTDRKPVNHLIEIATPENYFKNRYSISKLKNLANNDWLDYISISTSLSMSIEQNLLEITSGLVFCDGLNKLNTLREELKFYPPDICKLRMAALWNYIWNKEAFIGRCIALDDFTGLKINAARIAGYLIKILFYLEERYIPYSKWLGTAFKQLKVYKTTGPMIDAALRENEPSRIEAGLCALYEKVLEEHNKNPHLLHIKNKTRNFFNRPYRVIFAENIVEELVKSITDENIRKTDLKQCGLDLALDF